MSVAGDDALILTLDIGTSSVRAQLYDARARAVPDMDARVETVVRTTADGGAEFDADALFEAVASCIDTVLRLAGPDARRIAAVASATLVGNVLGIGPAGRVATPLYTWADTRSTAAATELRAMLDEHAVHDRTGCMLRSSYLPAQLRRLRQNNPELFRAVVHWLSIGEYLHLRLFGATAVSYSVASWSGLLDRRRLTWDADLLAVAGIKASQLSPLVDRDQPQTGLLPAYAQRWPALAEVPWFPAVGDGAASSVGCGCVSSDRMALALGTSGAVRVLVEGTLPSIPPGLWVYRLDRRWSLLGGALSEGGNLFAWLGDTLALAPDPATIEQELAALPPDGHGLTVLPFVAGERSPGWHGDARATISGLSLHTRPIEIVRAGLEAIGYRFALLAGLTYKAVEMPQEVVASGGPILHSPAWAQIICDILGRPVTLSAEGEATSRGTALLALHSLRMIAGLDELSAEIGQQIRPQSASASIYQKAAERHRRLYELLIERPSA